MTPRGSYRTGRAPRGACHRPGSRARRSSNVAAYPPWQKYLREHCPPTLVVWGGHDALFTVEGAFAFKRERPGAEVHVLDAGHFALDEEADTVAALMHRFLAPGTSRCSTTAKGS